MSDGKKYYCFCSSNCKYETMTKEQIITAIEQAVEDGEIRDVDTGFVTRVQELHAAKALTFWIGTMAAYNAIETPETNCLYIITDDTQEDDLNNTMESLMRNVEELQEQCGALLGDTKYTNGNKEYISHRGIGYLTSGTDGVHVAITIPVSKTIDADAVLFDGNVALCPCIPDNEMLRLGTLINNSNGVIPKFELRPTGIFTQVLIPEDLYTGDAMSVVWDVDINGTFTFLK